MLSPLRTAKALYMLGSLVKDPSRLAKVFEMADAISTPETILPMVQDLSRNPAIARTFVDRHRVDVDIADLRQREPGSLGRVFAEHMDALGLDPKALPRLPSDDEVGFFRAHLYETHDVWHVLTGFGTDWVGEIGLQAFYLAQIAGPLPALLIAVGCLRVAAYERTTAHALFDAITDGWARGKAAKPLFGVRWDELWDAPLEEVRARLGVAPVAPAAREALATAA